MSTHDDTIPTLGISEAFRYLPADHRRRADHAVLDRAHRWPSSAAAKDVTRHGTDSPLPRASSSSCCWACRSRSRSGSSCLATFARRRPAVRDRDADDDLGHERVLVPRDPVLHLLRRADAARRHRRQDRATSRAASVGHWRAASAWPTWSRRTLFGGVSGSPVADTSAMGGVMIPMMKREGYSAAYAVNVTTHASLSGALMPTSHNMIIYAFAAQAATGDDRRPRDQRRVDRRPDVRRPDPGASGSWSACWSRPTGRRCDTAIRSAPDGSSTDPQRFPAGARCCAPSSRRCRA